MQCYSLVNRLKADFPVADIEVIDYTAQKIMNTYENEFFRIKNKKVKRRFEERKTFFHAAQDKLPTSQWKDVSDNMENAIRFMNETYDAIVVGSDAVWNWTVRGFPNLYFLKDYKGLKFSYAASVHGMNYQNMTEEQKAYLKEAFSDFKYIGTRDITTEKMVEFCESSVKPLHNCDPTAFLKVDEGLCDIEKLKQKLSALGVDFSKPLIGIMAGNNIGREIKRHYGNKVQLIALYEPNKYSDIQLYDLNPFEWARVFSLFDLTITHFFHGTMLSLVNAVPVIPIEFVNDFSVRNTTKIQDVMQRLGLSSWRFLCDIRKRTFIQKVLNKLGVCTERKFWKEVFKQIDDFLTNDYKDIIRERLCKEAKTYDSFYDTLKKYIS